MPWRIEYYFTSRVIKLVVPVEGRAMRQKKLIEGGSLPQQLPFNGGGEEVILPLGGWGKQMVQSIPIPLSSCQ